MENNKTQYGMIVSTKQVDLSVGSISDLELMDTAKRLAVRGIANEEDAQSFANTIGRITKRQKEVITKRTKFMSPFKSDITAIEKMFNDHAKELVTLLKPLNVEYQKYEVKRQAEKEKKAKAEAERIAKAEAERLAKQRELEAQQAAEEAEDDLFYEPEEEPVKLATPSKPVQAETLPSQPVATPSKPVDKKVKTDDGHTIIVEHEAVPIIVDHALVPDTFKDINLRRLIVAYEEGERSIPGVRFELKPKTVVR
jgi:hypothetical protein